MNDKFSSQLPSLANEIWTPCDKDKDNCLSRKEVDLAMLDPAITGQRAAALATVKKSFDWLSGLCSSDHSKHASVTHADMDKLIENEGTAKYLASEKFFHDAQNNLNNYEHKTFSKANYNEPSKDDPVQGPLEDCYLISALSDFAAKRPEIIKRLISEDKSTDSYKVDFQFGKEHLAMLIPKPTESAIAYYRTQVDWPLAIQCAYGRFLKQLTTQLKPAERKTLLQLHGLSKNHKPSTLDQDNLTGGGYPMTTMMILGGSLGARHLIWNEPLSTTDQEKLTKVLESGIIGSSPAVATTAAGDSIYNLGLIPNHAYSIVDYIPDTHMVRIRNPYGNLTTVPSNSDLINVNGAGEIDVPFEKFIKAFEDINIYYDRPTEKSDKAFAAIKPVTNKKTKKLDLCLHSLDNPVSDP